jgi:hypothetical protein
MFAYITGIFLLLVAVKIQAFLKTRAEDILPPCFAAKNAATQGKLQ